MIFEFKDLPVDTFFQPEVRAGLKTYPYTGSLKSSQPPQYPHQCYKKIDEVSAIRIEAEEKNDVQVVFYPDDKITYCSLPIDGEDNLLKIGDPVIFNRYNKIYDGVIIAIVKRTVNSNAYDLRQVRYRIAQGYDMDYWWRNQTIFTPKLKVQSPGLKKPMLITYPRRMRKGTIVV